MSAKAYYSEKDRCWYVPVAWELWNTSDEGNLLPAEPVRVELRDGELLITQLYAVEQDERL